MRTSTLILASVLWFGCGSSEEPASVATEDPLRTALTFYAPFDGGMDAAFARGDARIFHAPDYKQQAAAVAGYSGGDIEIVPGDGRFGDALRFNKKNVSALFFQGETNVAFSSAGWSGTISFWLSLDPNVTLEPGFCDPIQVTDSAYNDNAIWVDFTRDDPRKFRLGVFGELDEWNPENLDNNDNATFNDRLVVVDQPPFADGKWTHVVIVHEALGTPEGAATLYLDGAKIGSSTGISEPFQWDMANAAIRVGVNYVGLYDELALFDRPLTGDEVALLHGLAGGVGAL